MKQSTLLIILSVAAPSVLFQAESRAEELSKEACVIAHGLGQDARDRGELRLAKTQFLTCSQKACPGIVRDDCAQLADQLVRLQPTVNFVARDTYGTDLGQTSVFVDDVLVLSGISSGASTALDPGKHRIRFVNGDQEQTKTIVVHVGEKARTILATFEPRASRRAVDLSADGSVSRPLAGYLVTGLGLAALVGGGVVAYLGISEVPAGCSISTAECAVSPGHPDLERASDGVATMNVGFAVASAGAVLAVGGAIWLYLGSSRSEAGALGTENRTTQVLPFVGAGNGGFAVAGTW